MSTVQGWCNGKGSFPVAPRENLFQHHSRNRSFISYNFIPSSPYSCLLQLVLKCEIPSCSLERLVRVLPQHHVTVDSLKFQFLIVCFLGI